MATAETLIAIVGGPVDSDEVRRLIAVDRLVHSTEPDLEEGEELRSFLSNPASGYQLMHRSGQVAAAFLYAEPAEGFVAFPSQLPGGISRGATRSQVRAQFGKPERAGEAVTIHGLGRQGPWDRFAVRDVRIHFRYTEIGHRIQLVTIMAADDAP